VDGLEAVLKEMVDALQGLKDSNGAIGVACRRAETTDSPVLPIRAF
jgi:hypothetical protein